MAEGEEAMDAATADEPEVQQGAHAGEQQGAAEQKEQEEVPDGEEAENDDDLMDDQLVDESEGGAGSIFCPRVPSTPSQPSAPGTPGKGRGKGASPGAGLTLLMCCICLTNPRAKKATYCDSPCAADVKAAERDAARRSQSNRRSQQSKGGRGKGKKELDPESDQARFRELKRRGGEDFRQAILTYRARCMGHGRGYTRPSFDWVRYFIAVTVASRQQVGSKALYMNQAQFEMYMMQTEGTARDVAALDFRRRLSDPKSRKKDKDGVMHVLVPTEDFVTYVNEKSFEETTQWGTKDKKNPDDADISKFEECMGTDHRGFHDTGFWNVDTGKGEGPGVAATNLYSISSANTGASSSDRAAGATAFGADRRGADAEEDSRPSKKAKRFDIGGAKTALAPMIAGLLDKVKKSADDVLTTAKDVSESIRISEWAETFKEGNDLLKQRLECAQKVFPLADVELNFAKDELQKHRNSEEVKRRFNENGEPAASWNGFKVWAEHAAEAKVFTVTEEEHVAEIKATTREGLAPYEELITRVKDQARRLKNSLAARNLAKKKQDEKELSLAQTEASRAQAVTDQARPIVPVPAADKMYAVLSVELPHSCKPILVVEWEALKDT